MPTLSLNHDCLEIVAKSLDTRSRALFCRVSKNAYAAGFTALYESVTLSNIKQLDQFLATLRSHRPEARDCVRSLRETGGDGYRETQELARLLHEILLLTRNLVRLGISHSFKLLNAANPQLVECIARLPSISVLKLEVIDESSERRLEALPPLRALQASTALSPLDEPASSLITAGLAAVLRASTATLTALAVPSEQLIALMSADAAICWPALRELRLDWLESLTKLDVIRLSSLRRLALPYNDVTADLLSDTTWLPALEDLQCAWLTADGTEQRRWRRISHLRLQWQAGIAAGRSLRTALSTLDARALTVLRFGLDCITEDIAQVAGILFPACVNLDALAVSCQMYIFYVVSFLVPFRAGRPGHAPALRHLRIDMHGFVHRGFIWPDAVQQVRGALAGMPVLQYAQICIDPTREPEGGRHWRILRERLVKPELLPVSKEEADAAGPDWSDVVVI